MIEFSEFTLENGLKVLVHNDNATPLVAMNIIYDVGARDEDPERTGFAHLFEHLMFGGSVNIPVYDEPLQKAGGENNAFTNNDFTDYYISVPASNLETAFWLESDRMLDLAFSEKSLEVQRNVVMEEYKQRYLNQPYGDIWLLLRELAYKVHPYRWPTIGLDIEHIRNAGMEDVRSFYNRFYHPSNAIMSLAGNISHNEAEDLCARWFAPLPGRKKLARIIDPEPVQTKKRFLEVERDVPSDVICRAYHMCSRMHPDYYACDLLSDILSNGKSSRLYQKLVIERQVFADMDASITGDNDPGLFLFSGRLVEGVKLHEADKALEEVIQEIKANPVSDYELEKVKNKNEAANEYSNMSIMNKAMKLGVSCLLGDVSLVNTESSLYARVDAVQLKKVAEEVLREENCSTLYYKSNKTHS